nr:hypothetical protein [Tanacetum cinerariifolium]
MANMTAPSGQAPAVAPPVRTNEWIVPRIRWVQIGYLKFSAKGTKREVFGMPILGSAQDSPAPKLAKPARKPKPTAQKARINILQWQSAPASDHLNKKCTIEFRAKRSSKIISLGHYPIMLASSHTVKSKADIKSPTHYPCANELTDAFGKPFEVLNNVFEHWVFNSLVHSFRALSALRLSGLRTASTAAKPCQGDSLEFYLITGRILTVAAADQKVVKSQLDAHTPNSLSMTAKRPTTQLPQL